MQSYYLQITDRLMSNYIKSLFRMVFSSDAQYIFVACLLHIHAMATTHYTQSFPDDFVSCFD